MRILRLFEGTFSLDAAQVWNWIIPNHHCKADTDVIKKVATVYHSDDKLFHFTVLHWGSYLKFDGRFIVGNAYLLFYPSVLNMRVL